MPIRTKDYKFTRLNLTRPEFNTLVFMGNPPIWEKYANDPSHEFLLNLCFRPLEQVVKEVMKKITGAPIKAVSVFEKLQSIQVKNEEKPWFERHLKLCEKFDESLMGPLWIRNVAKDENKQFEKKYGDGSFYIEDGNHRALVYAVLVECGDLQYNKVEALHATSWDIAEGILGHPVQASQELEHEGYLQADAQDYISGFQGPITLFERIEKDT